MNAETMFEAIKVQYDRKVKIYFVDWQSGGAGDVIAFINSGYYVTDTLAALDKRIASGSCAWFNNLNEVKREAVRKFLNIHFAP